jgi:hypothetical protein
MANPNHLKALKKGAESWNQWQSENFMVRPDLSDVDLGGVDFSAVSFQNANLTCSNFDGAKFVGANLRQADFSSASLKDTDFNSAFMPGVELTFANLTGTDFTNATWDGNILTGLDLSKVKGMETIRHHGPSFISLDTLYNSKGKIPEIFLRGCGLQEDFISYLPSLLKQPFSFYSCFISYNHEDKPFAHLLHDRLQGRGIRCWLDEHQLLPGDDIHDRIDHGIKLWDKVLLCASKSSLTSWWVDAEIDRAFRKESQLMKERKKKVLALIPLNLDGFLFGKDYQSGKKLEIESRIAANFVGWEKDHALFDRELEKVIRALRTDDGGRETPPLTRL